MVLEFPWRHDSGYVVGLQAQRWLGSAIEFDPLRLERRSFAIGADGFSGIDHLPELLPAGCIADQMDA